MHRIDVAIVGAGPAGLGVALMLARLPGIRLVVLEAGEVGESFRRWPEQTRFITPSFHSNPFGLADLNAISEASSPAIFSGTEHPSGQQYADYLSLVAEGHGLPVISQCRVERVDAEVEASEPGFVLHSTQGTLRSRFLIWATGEFQFPDLEPFPGSRWCHHYVQVPDWRTLQGTQHTVIGGYESGVDAAIQLVRLGHAVHLLTRTSSWDAQASPDPSLSLSPFTRERLHAALDTGRLEISLGVNVVEVSGDTAGGFRIRTEDGRYWDTPEAPVLGTGFLRGGGARQIGQLWDWNKAGQIMLTEADESTRTPGLFLVGPQVRHDQRIYCFIYKFRQRFEVVARQIALRMKVDAAPLQQGAGAWGPFGNADCCEGCEC